ncbi:MAG TPA: tetratricopeptide repeat protein [Rhodothermales bacterium]|nr:tetratricopeptide repeat protein [Rhodothermales bacterium]
MTILSGVVVHAQVDANARKFLVASQFMKSGQFERAIPLLEDLYSDDPGTNAYFVRLKEAYSEMKRYDDAIRIVDERISVGRTPYLLAERGALLIWKEDEEGALHAWEEAIGLAPDRSLPYREVYQAMVSVRMYEEAVDVLLRARRALDFPSAFRNELAELFSLTGRNTEAMNEYLELIRESPDQQPYVRSRLTRMGQNEDMFVEAMPVLEEAVRKDPTNRPIRELAAWMYRETGRYDRALDASRAIDRLENEEGRVLFVFALNAADAEAFEQAFAALDDIVRWYPDSPSATSAVLSRADLHNRIGEVTGESPFDGRGNRIPAEHFDSALKGYRFFMQQYPNDPRLPDVLWRMAIVQLNVYHELGEAESLFDEIVRLHPGSPMANQARYDLSVIRLLRGDLPGARLAFSRLEDELRTGELAERSRFELAQVAFYEGHFESALTLVDALDENTASDIANDAIELKVLLRENRGPDSLDSALRGYAQSDLAFRQRRFAEALDILEQLQLAHQKHPLIDEIRFKRSEALEQVGRFEESQAEFLAVATDYADSYLADRSLFAVARIYEERLGDAPAAIEAYSEVLLRYPGSLLAPKVRARIRKLRGDHV